MTHVLRCLGLQYSSSEIDQLIREFDDDNSGTVELEEFVNIFDKMVSAIHIPYPVSSWVKLKRTIF